MKKIFLILVLCFSLTACGTDKTQRNSNTPKTVTPAASEAKVSDYFAFTKDTHMNYKGTGNEYATYETYVDYIKDNIVQERTNNGGTVSVSVYTLKDGALKKVFNQGEIYYRYDYTSSKSMDEILIKEPIKAGTSWTLSDGAARSITAVDKQIKTPTGDFSALEITTKRPDSTIRDYYVKNIGHVKSEFSPSNSSDTVTSELEKIEKGVPLKQTIRFYFPEFSKDRVVYIDRAIDIYTNEDMKYKFQKELKTIPAGSDLSKVLSANASVLGSVIDEKNKTVTVDFSSQLISEMNAGTSFESMLIKSITNTFGTYYQKDKVIITIEGKPYESGHILLKKGEYFTVQTKDTVEYK